MHPWQGPFNIPYATKGMDQIRPKQELFQIIQTVGFGNSGHEPQTLTEMVEGEPGFVSNTAQRPPFHRAVGMDR